MKVRLFAAIGVFCLALLACAAPPPATPDPAAEAPTMPAATPTTANTTDPPAPPATPTPPAAATPTAALPATPTPAPGEPVHAITIFDRGFNPASVQVDIGDQLTWTNTGSLPHTVTFADDGPDSGTLAGGATFQHTFDSAGTFEYICTIHPSMRGTITVGE